MYLLANTDNDIDGPTALPSIVSPIRIEAYGVTLGRTSGSPAFRFFLVGRAGALRLNGLTVTEGDSGSGSGKSGGALLNRGGNVTVVDSVFEGNTAFFGGAIYNDGGTLTIHDSTITRNTAIGSGAGLINVGGRVIVSRTDFDANHGSGDGSVETEGGEMYIVGSRFLNCGFRKF
jgi:predicted outer membrane repeat protein